MYTSRFGRGNVLQTITTVDTYDESEFKNVPYLDSVAVWDQEKEELVIFAVNKNLEESIDLSCDLYSFRGYDIKEHIVVTHEDVKAANTEENPYEVKPVAAENDCVEDGVLKAVLPEKSWNMILLQKTRE